MMAAVICSVSAFAEFIPSDFGGAKWIWFSPGDNFVLNEVPLECCFFRGELILPGYAQVVQGGVIVTADNVFKLYVNGKLVGQSSAESNAWSSPLHFDVTKALTPGRNVISVEAVNIAKGPAGLLLKMEVRLAGAETFNMVSDAKWKAAKEYTEGWEHSEYNDSAWRSAHSIGEYGIGPWGQVKPREANQMLANVVAPPEDFTWPEAVAFIGEDCSLNQSTPRTTGSYNSLGVTVFTTRNSRSYPEHDLPAPIKVGKKLYILKPAKPGTEPKLLLDAGKGAMGSPSVSFDGQWIYVSMAYDGEPFYHIYKISAAGGKPERLTDGPFHDVDPTELPDGRIVFTSTRIGRFEEYHCPPSRALFIMNSDGKEMHPLTNTFIFDNEPEVMADGRIVILRSDNFFDRGKVETMLHAIRPDGTGGQTIFGIDNGPEYGGRLRAYYCGSPAPMPDGRVAFVSGPGITVGWPSTPQDKQLHLHIPVGDVAALPDGHLLCTLAKGIFREKIVGKEKQFSFHQEYQQIGIVDPDDAETKVVTMYESRNESLHSPVYVGFRKRPPALMDIVDHKKADDGGATGFLFCQNARLTRNTTAGWPHVRAIRVLASRGLTARSSHSYIVHTGSEVVELGTVPLAPDGSFSVEVPADTAIAFQAVDGEGRSELNEMSWIFVRPGEFRGCVGCHSSRQAAPPSLTTRMEAMRATPLKLLGKGNPHHFRGNNAAVTGLMELQFDRYREVAGVNRHSLLDQPLISGKEEVTALIKQLEGSDEGLKLSAAQRLSIYRDPNAAPALAKGLGEKSREVRVATAMALATCGTRDSVQPLLKALSDSDPLVAQAASIALENITGHNPEYKAFVNAGDKETEAAKWRDWFGTTDWDAIEKELVQRIESGDNFLVRRSAVALGHIGSSISAVALSGYVQRERNNNPYPDWRKNHRGDGARFNSLSPANPRTLQAVTRALGYVGDTNSVTMLTETVSRFNDPGQGNLFLTEAAVEALGRIATPEAEQALIDAFAAFKDYQHYSEWYGDHGALIACHSSPPHYLVLEALDAMGCTNAARIVPQMISSVPTDPDRALLMVNDDYEILTGRVIRRSGCEADVVETCLSILGDAAYTNKQEIADAIAKVHGAWGGKPVPENRAAQMVSLVCRDRKYEPAIRAAFDRYRAMTNDIERVFHTGIPVVDKMPLKHWVCFFLARSLGNLGEKASVDSLVAALEQPAEATFGYPDPLGPGVLFLHNDLTPCWRAASAWALGEIGDKKAVPVLLKTAGNLLNAVDTRYASAEALGKIADPASIPAIKKLADDYPEVSTRRALLRICNPYEGF